MPSSSTAAGEAVRRPDRARPRGPRRVPRPRREVLPHPVRRPARPHHLRHAAPPDDAARPSTSASSSSTSTRRAWRARRARAVAVGRDVVAGLVDKLFDKYGVAILGFDVVFAEPDRSSGLRVLDGLAKGPLKDVPDFQAALAELRPRLDHDAQFVRTIKGRPVVLGYYLTSDRDARTSGAAAAAGARARDVREPADRVHVVDRLRRQPRRLPGGGGERPGTSTRSPTRTGSTGACRCSPNTRARTTSRCRSR